MKNKWVKVIFASDCIYEDWDGDSTLRSINAGSLQRIADAVEKMASSYDKMRNDRDIYERWYKDGLKSIEFLQRSNASLRGHMTRLRRLNKK